MDDELRDFERRLTRGLHRIAETVPVDEHEDTVVARVTARHATAQSSLVRLAAAFTVLLLAVVAVSGALPSAVPGESAPPEARGEVPDVIGLTLDEATSRLHAAGYSLEVMPGQAPTATDAALQQWPPGGWPGQVAGSAIRVSFAFTDSLGRTQSLPAHAADGILALATAELRAASAEEWAVVAVEPVAEDGKGKSCARGECAIVKMTTEARGVFAWVDRRGNEAAVELQWHPSPLPLESPYSTDELVAIAAADPTVQSAIAGLDATLRFLSPGDVGGNCAIRGSQSTCVTIGIYSKNAAATSEIGLVTVDYLTRQVTLVRVPETP